MTAAPPARTTAALAARRRSTEGKLEQVRVALARLRREHSDVTFPAVARRAAVSRTFLYANPEARSLVERALTRKTTDRARSSIELDVAQDVSWRERAFNAEDALGRVSGRDQ